MVTPTDRQRQLTTELARTGKLIDKLTNAQRMAVMRGTKPGATYAHISQALDILRTARDAHTAKGADPTDTPYDTFGDRLAAWEAAWETFQGKHAKAKSLAAVVHQVQNPAVCIDCGHQHDGAPKCPGVVTDPVDPRGTIPCPCQQFVPPDMESAFAWHAAQACYPAARHAKTTFDAVYEYRPGDPLVVTGGTMVDIGTEGVFIRQQQADKGLAYVMRTEEGDVWIAHNACARVGDELLPDTLPDVITEILSNEDLAP